MCNTQREKRRMKVCVSGHVYSDRKEKREKKKKVMWGERDHMHVSQTDMGGKERPL